jgi:mRNA-degrading endonuclease YafQ of YafQ-DinJ toxin-antitoxin module
MKFEQLGEFEKDFKKLLKRYRTLEDDLDVVKQVLTVEPKERPPFSFKIDGLGLTTCVIKVKKMTCRSLKGKGANSGLRLIYAHFEEEKKITLVEIYHKNDKENEDRDRIMKNFK